MSGCSLRGIKVGDSSLRGNRLQPKMCHIVAQFAMLGMCWLHPIFPLFVAQTQFLQFSNRFLAYSAFHNAFLKFLFKTLVLSGLQKYACEIQFFTRLKKCHCFKRRLTFNFAASNFDFAHNQIFAAYGTTCYNQNQEWHSASL